jgi:hypothetical protein
LAKFANFMCGDFPKVNKLPTMGHENGPGGNRWDFLNRNGCTATPKRINNKSMLKNPSFSNNLLNFCTSWNINTSMLL